MPSYKLTYFNLAGLGEPIRFLLSYGGISFEDNRIAQVAWPELKPKTPLEQLPILEVDGKTLYQSNSISRYLARKFGLFGSNDFEAFEVDVSIETIGDLRQVLAKWFFMTNEIEKAAARTETFTKADFYLSKFEATVQKNGGYFVGGKLTAADIVFAGFQPFLSHLAGQDIVADRPNLKALVERVVSLPGIKSYIAQRPETDF